MIYFFYFAEIQWLIEIFTVRRAPQNERYRIAKIFAVSQMLQPLSVGVSPNIPYSRLQKPDDLDEGLRVVRRQSDEYQG